MRTHTSIHTNHTYTQITHALRATGARSGPAALPVGVDGTQDHRTGGGRERAVQGPDAIHAREWHVVGR
eukprot:20193-Eustigmatos_ZCMA.PRE.1